MKSMNILVVDDDLITREVIKSILISSFRDHEVIALIDEAQNGKEALAKFKKHPYQLILLDYRMPGMNGMKLVEQLRELEKAKTSEQRIPIICISSTVNQENEQYFFDAGFDMCLCKPFDAETLQKMIEIFSEPRPLGRAYNIKLTQ